jgi:hypothetical protein
MKIIVAAALLSLTTLAIADDKNAMKPPTPPKEIADMGKTMSGTWKCKGTGFMPDGKKVELTGTMKSALEMNGMWIHDTYDATMAGSPFHFESYTTYDGTGKHFHRIMAESDGGLAEGEGHMNGTTKLDYELDTHGPHGDGKFKDHIDWSDMKAGVKATGEMSMDKGKTWVKVYEQTCTK